MQYYYFTLRPAVNPKKILPRVLMLLDVGQPATSKREMSEMFLAGGGAKIPKGQQVSFGASRCVMRGGLSARWADENS